MKFKRYDSEVHQKAGSGQKVAPPTGYSLHGFYRRIILRFDVDVRINRAKAMGEKSNTEVANARHLLDLLAQHGGKIISSNDLHPYLIEQARAAGRMYVDENSLGYIWEPPFAGRFPETDEELEMFDWCYPLESKLPEQLENADWVKKLLEEVKT